jgi:hypothetical protein
MPGPYYANMTQKRKRYFSVNPLGNRLVITHRSECWQVRIIALQPLPLYSLCTAYLGAPPRMHFNVLGSRRTMRWKLVSS